MGCRRWGTSHVGNVDAGSLTNPRRIGGIAADQSMLSEIWVFGEVFESPCRDVNRLASAPIAAPKPLVTMSLGSEIPNWNQPCNTSIEHDRAMDPKTIGAMRCPRRDQKNPAGAKRAMFNSQATSICTTLLHNVESHIHASDHSPGPQDGRTSMRSTMVTIRIKPIDSNAEVRSWNLWRNRVSTDDDAMIRFLHQVKFAHTGLA